MQICTRNRTEVENALPIQQQFTLRSRDVVKKLILKKSISSTTVDMVDYPTELMYSDWTIRSDARSVH